jgi:SAM-dependent methyltransferase
MTQPIIVPPSLLAQAIDDVGAFFEPLNGIDRETLGRDHLNPEKAVARAALLQRYITMADRKGLEIGAGYGTNLAMWIKAYGVDGYGVEPASQGFEKSFLAAKTLFVENGLDASRIIDASGENLPFPDGFFDFVYSANVLEHTADPLQVLREAVRVLKPGGILHFEIPNYLSYFEGHYMLPMPPMWSHRMLALWVRIFGRDPAFVWTLKLINPIWCRHAVAGIGRTCPVSLVSLGEDVFLEKLAGTFTFETQTVSGKLGTAMGLLQKINVNNWVGRLIVALQGHYPLYLTVKKL